MKTFKTKVGITESFTIEKDIFEEKTKKLPPYYSEHIDKSTQKAVCPKCDNPIEIMGLYKKLENTDKPYGRHIKGGIKGLANYNEEAYHFCPYASHKVTLDKTDRKKSLKGIPTDIIEILKNHFDKVVYILTKDTGIRFSERLLRSMIKTYSAEEGYLYTGATLDNIPWIFAYMSDSQSLFSQIIEVDSELCNYLASCNDVELKELKEKEVKNKEVVQISKKGKAFFNYHFSFICHHRKNKDDSIEETLKFIVHKDGKTVFEQKIDIEETYFNNLLFYHKWETKKKYLDIFNEEFYQ